MKRLLFTALLATGLLLPANFTASTNNTVSKTELASNKQKKKSKKSKRSSSSSSSSKRSKSYSQSIIGCTHKGKQLYVGERGGCYYRIGKNKQYIDKSYCSNCN